LVKKKKVNVTVDPDVWALAKSMRLNCSEICNDALKLAVSVQDDKKQMLEAIERKNKEIGMLEKYMEKLDEANERVNESMGSEEDRFEDAINTIKKVNKKNGFVGTNFILQIANHQNLDYNELIIKLPKEVEIRKFQEV